MHRFQGQKDSTFQFFTPKLLPFPAHLCTWWLLLVAGRCGKIPSLLDNSLICPIWEPFDISLEAPSAAHPSMSGTLSWWAKKVFNRSQPHGAGDGGAPWGVFTFHEFCLPACYLPPSFPPSLLYENSSFPLKPLWIEFSVTCNISYVIYRTPKSGNSALVTNSSHLTTRKIRSNQGKGREMKPELWSDNSWLTPSQWSSW